MENFHTKHKCISPPIFYHKIGLDAAYLNERKRQAMLLRLKREKLRAMREDKFNNAAMMIGLAERQQAELDEK